ncbi:MAG TPA: glycosyltransferase family 4 protein [Smithella sp.]|nr:glycosyltransferase family 4 protein [Smithella sp.]HNY49685.1 glycosyltransferase family 4 protein [Smithella sp.]HOU50845.1 glycosyltransferase family 4 protein [Smithella sp.]HQG64872.1 glycosyltransferase family 4 protein [Smithella sp.]HQH15995.1 glycosyltransferase family 4 protein [Smithella sp.]
MMRTLHVLDIPWWSALSAYAFCCMETEKKSGIESYLACPKNSLSFRKAKENSLNIKTIHGRDILSAGLNFIKIGTICQNVKPDVIIVHTGSLHFITFIWSAIHRLPVIRTRIIAQTVNKNLLNKFLYKHTSRLIAPTEKIRRELIDKLSLDADKIQTLYFPAGVDDTTDVVLPGRKSVGMIGRLDPVKGHATFLEAAANVQSKLEDVEFHIAGSEENIQWETLEKMCRQLGLKNIFYHGFLSKDKLKSFINNCSVGVVASYDSEVVSRATVEWMAAGRPVVATSVGCIPEILDSEVGGYIVPTKDADAMAEKIIFLLGHNNTAEAMGKKNLDKAKTVLSRENFENSWLSILESVK